jgi:hypothetical protein
MRRQLDERLLSGGAGSGAAGDQPLAGPGDVQDLALELQRPGLNWGWGVPTACPTGMAVLVIGIAAVLAERVTPVPASRAPAGLVAGSPALTTRC